MHDQTDKVAVDQLIQRERWARDNHMFDEMAGCYHPDSLVEVQWFRGSGAEFVRQSSGAVREGLINFHVMSPSIVTVRGDRAIAETPATLRNFWEVDGIEGSIEGFIRMRFRALRQNGEWLLAGLRVIYVRDMLYACNPTRPPVFDQEKLKQFRLSYRYMAYHLTRLGLTPKNDMPGVDKPETVAALRKAEADWLAGVGE